METYLSQYLISEEDLAQCERKFRETISQNLVSDNRLRAFLQLFILAKVSMETIDEMDLSAFVRTLQDDVDKAKNNLSERLATRAAEVKKKTEKMQDEAQALEDEFRERGKCIEDVLQGLETVTDSQDVNALRDVINEKMSTLEQLISSYVKLRQEQSFTELCQLAQGQANALN